MELILSITFGLISMLSYGSANAYAKPLSQTYGGAALIFLRGVTIAAAMAVATVVVSVTGHATWSVQWSVLVAALVLGMIGYLNPLWFFKSMKLSPLGVVAPVAGTAPLFTLLLSVAFLGAALSHGQWWAAAVVIIANIAVTVETKNWRSGRFFRKSEGIPFALAAAVGWGLFAFALAAISKSIGPWLSTLMAEIGVALAAYIHCVVMKQPVELKAMFKPSVIINGLLVGIGTLAFAIGAGMFNVGIVAALSNSTAIVTTLVGVIVFHEHIHKRDWIAGGAMVAGIAALSLL